MESNRVIDYINNIDEVWDRAAPLIEPALDHAGGEITIDDVKEKLKSGKMGMISINDFEAVCTVEFVDYSRISALRVVTLAGHNMEYWLDELIQYLVNWAESYKLGRIEHLGRKGWQRVLEKHGFVASYIFMTKAVDNGKIIRAANGS
jgi:hypothetical protein